MRRRSGTICDVCGPFTESMPLIEFVDADNDEHGVCVNCVVGVLTSIDMPGEAIDAFVAAWADEVLATNREGAPDGD
jgi:hypothetical protein